MQLKPHRYEHYNTTLRDLLQTITTLIRNYVSTLKSHTPNLITQANRLWELRQRHRLVIGYQIHTVLCCRQSQLEALDEIANNIADFERTSNELREEAQEETQSSELTTLSSWTAWLLETLNVLQTQAKYLELHTRSMQPMAMESTTVKRFRKDLQLVKEYELNICMGIAKAERQQPGILPPVATAT
ncbi:hypothetical protein KR093_003728 [Drosophila rubida]|uniref:Uncharacterized protein n=1 Tax=Drosophila rubida TaxID=30044 RepID=A0AAD4PR47_9MUSC|nr:hypothetical protein KR093_003728 [Drosophila rubida]